MSLDSNLLSHLGDQDGNYVKDISEEDSDNGDGTEVTQGQFFDPNLFKLMNYFL